MKLLFDFLPIALFFGMFKYAEGQRDWAAALASQWLGLFVTGGVVGPSEAPVLLATVVVICATLGQVLWLLARKQKVDFMLWISLGLVVVLGGTTIYLHNETFIKIKPTLLYWLMGGSLLMAQLIFKKNGIQTLLGTQINVPDFVWRRLNASWIIFFALMGGLNLWVAFSFPTSTWVNFKLFGAMGCTLIFAIAQALYLGRYSATETQT